MYRLDAAGDFAVVHAFAGGAYGELFLPQRVHGIHPRCPPRGRPAGQHAYQDQRCRDTQICRRIPGSIWNSIGFRNGVENQRASNPPTSPRIVNTNACLSMSQSTW